VRLVAVFRDVHHNDALVHVHLAGSEADAGSGIHGLQHVGDQGSYRIVDLAHWSGSGAEPWIWIFEYV